jgi:hypothetical protein
MARALALLPAAALVAGLAMPAAVFAQRPAPGSPAARIETLEAQVAALEVRVAYLEGRATPIGPPGPFAWPSPDQQLVLLERRLRSLEIRVGKVEARRPLATGPACRRLNVNGSRIPPGGTLSVTVNGTIVGTWDEAAYGDLEPFMRPGPNLIGLAFAAAPAGTTADAELRCLPPGAESSRTVVLRLRPAPGRLSAETVVVLP